MFTLDIDNDIVFPAGCNGKTEPYGYQVSLAELFVSDEPAIVVLKSRQIGVTHTFVASIAHLLKTNPNHKILYATPRLEMAEMVVDAVANITPNLTVWRRNELRLKNNSLLRGLPVSSNGINSGYRFDLIITDEVVGLDLTITDRCHATRRIVAASHNDNFIFYNRFFDPTWKQVFLPHAFHPDHNDEFVQNMTQAYGEDDYKKMFCCDF